MHLVHQAVDRATANGSIPISCFPITMGRPRCILWTGPWRPLRRKWRRISSIWRGAAFLQAAGFFLPCHRAHIVKVVSDNLALDSINREAVTRLMENALPAVEHIIESIPRDGKQGDTADRMSVFSWIGDRWRLTASQRAQLDRAGRAWLLRHPDGDLVWPDDVEAPRDKQSRNQALAVLLNRLWEG